MEWKQKDGIKGGKRGGRKGQEREELREMDLTTAESWSEIEKPFN